MADVTWKLFADAQAAERAIVGLEKKYTDLENKVGRLSKQSRKSSNDAVSDLKAWATGLVSVSAGLQIIEQAIGFVTTANEKFIHQADELGLKYDVLIRKYRILGNLSAMEGQQAQKVIQATAAQYGYSNTEGQLAANAMVSAGFDAAEVERGGLSALFKTMAASGEFGETVDARTLAESMAAYLSSQGEELTGANIEKAGVAVAQLANVSTMGIGDIGELAKRGAVFSDRLTTEEQFAAATMLRKVGTPGAEAATSMRSITLAMTAGSRDKRKVEALKQFGLTPDDVDLQGESFVDVLKTFRDSMATMDPKMKDPALKKFFETENVASAMALITNADIVEEFTKAQTDVAGFERSVGIATSGPAAANRRMKAENDARTAERAMFDENVKEGLESLGLEQGYSAASIEADKVAYQMLRNIGVSQDTAIGMSRDPEGLRAVLEESVKEAKEQTRLLKEVTQNQRQRPINRNAQGEGAR